MAKIKYTGRDDSRELSAADLAKADVSDFRKTTFARGEATEVSDAAAAILTDQESDDIFGTFEMVEDDEPEAKSTKTKDDGSTKATKSGAASNSPGTAGGTAGNGSST